MNVFASIGNGTACEPLPHSVLGPLRQMVYERIAKESKRRSTTLSWPLCLRPSHRVLLIANFVSEPDNDLDSKLYDADRFVVNGFISELTAVLQDVSVLNDANGLSQSFSSFKECPLSLIDARVFLYSLARLPPSEQVSGLSTFLTAVDDGFINIKESEASVFANKNVSHFLARVVSLSINMYCTVKYGAQSRDALKKVLLNSLTSISRIDLRPTSNWYTSERCFMSVFSDWEESGLPPNFSTQKYVSKTSEASLDRLLEKAFVLGFKTATSDHCHLLFASWNAIGKDALWKEISWSIKPFTRLPDGVALLILQLRDEMCSVSAQVKKVHGGQVHSLPMSKIVDEKLSTQRVSDAELKSLLQTMIKKASKIVDAVLRKYKPSFSTQGHDIPSEVFALLEGCAVYITYAVSMFTKPSGNFYFATMEKVSTRHMNRTRGNSIDSDFLHSDTGSADSHDASVETVERLRAVCYYLGAAPAHPDWLDKDCQLLECVSLNEAAEAANEANICLTKLISVGWSQCQFLQHSAIKATIAPGQDIRVAALVSKICQLQRFDVSMSSFLDYPTCNFQLEMAELCGLQPTFNHVLITDSAAKKRKIVNTTWCSRAAQRIVGQYHDVIRTKLATDASNAELRLSGEWEVLLSRMLSSSCLRVESGGENSAFRNKADFLIASSNQWHGVCFGALEALVPTVALLRFGLTTIGRAPHPLAVFMTTPENFETRRGSLVEPVSSDVVVPIAIRESLTSTLAMVALCPPAPICSAIATHLFIDTASFATLQGLVVVSTALEALSELNDVLVTEDRKFLMATSLMIDQAAAVLAAFGTGGAEKLTILHACLSHRSNLSSIRFDTFFSKQINPFVALSTAAVDNDTILSRNLWSREGSSGRFVRCLSSFVLNGSLCTRSKTRSFFAHAISSVIAKELSGDLSVSNRQCEVQSMFIESFNDVREGSIGDLVREVCESDSILEKRMDPFTSISSYPLNEKLSTLFALLLATGENCVSFKHTELVANTLEEMYNCWSVSALRQRKYVLNLTLLCSIRCGRVLKLGDKLFSDLQQKTLTEHMTGCFIENLRMFIELMAELHRLLLQEQVSSETSLRSKANSISLLPTSCSYVTKKDFHEQHWYNCYSCGLTNDKGCCSLCAVVCHQNHDIAYARYSSFFCDCGSAADSPESGSSINCQCLGLHTQDKFLTQREREVFDTLVSGDRNGMPFLSVRFCSLSVKLLYRNQGIFSVNNLIEKGRESSWVQFLFEFTKNAFERCKSQNTADNEEVSTQTITRSYNVLRSSMSEVAHNSFQLERLTHESFTKLGETLSGTFKVGTLDRKSRNFIARQVIDADCRGRIAIAESCDVVFFSGLPVVNECGAEGKFDGSLARSSMCALCSVSFGFQVLGVKFARECENVIVAWGYQEAKVCFMDISLTVVRDFVTLDLNVSAEDFSNNILGCHWLVGAGSCLIIGSSHGLKVFEVSTRADSISPAVVIPTSYQIRDFVVARVSDSESRSSVESQVKIWKTILLLENGSIREGILKQDEKGTISVNSPLNPCQILSVTRSTFVMDPFAEEVSSELESIVFLEKSKIVLYISSTLGVWAVILNEKGEQKESFKFLPSNFEFLSEEKNEIHIVTGPLSQFHELGIVQRDLGFFYRLSCTGVTSTGDHVCFCLEFNSSGAFIREMPKLNRSWSDPIHSFQGFAVFTAPCVFDDSDPYNLTRDRLFVERVVVCALTSNGSLHFYAEEKAAPTRAALGSSSRFDVTMLSYSSEMKFSEAPLLNRTPQLLSIENMKNISTSSNVVFAASGLGR